jgi:hypothetical protein
MINTDMPDYIAARAAFLFVHRIYHRAWRLGLDIDLDAVGDKLGAARETAIAARKAAYLPGTATAG